MYEPSQPVIYSTCRPDESGVPDYDGRYFQLYSNGVYQRTSRGEIVPRIASCPRHGIEYFHRDRTSIIHGWITDKILVERIRTYFERYFGKQWTNCSALAHFLTTGEFIECDYKNGWANPIISRGMRPYAAADSVGVGDMVAIAYADERFMQSRRMPFRRDFLQLKKERRLSGRFGMGLNTRGNSVSPEEIRTVCSDVATDDYHFLVCVDIWNGEPVWLSQRGNYKPGEDRIPVVITLGENDGYPDEVPLLTLIKKRR